jgi:hypothetical protein
MNPAELQRYKRLLLATLDELAVARKCLRNSGPTVSMLPRKI